MGSSTFEWFHSYTPHADYVTVSTGLRTNFVFDADLVAGAIPLSFDKTTATSYELRNYDGDVLKSGALTAGAPPTITDADLTWRGNGPYGWYRLYLFGSAKADWGTAYGDCTFYRVADSSLFPANPAASVSSVGANGNDEIAHAIMGLGAERANATLPALYSWGSPTAEASVGTSVTTARKNLGNGGALRSLVFHTFIGDPSELAAPTTSGYTATWTMESRVTKNSVTITCWSGSHGNGAEDLGLVTFSSGSKSGTHQLYYVVLQNGYWLAPRTAATSSGTGTSGSVTSGAQGFPGGVQKIVFAAAAIATPSAFGEWTPGYSKHAMSSSVLADQPLTPNSIMSVVSNLFADDSASTASASWGTSSDYVMCAVAVMAQSGSSLPTASTAQSKAYWNDHALSLRPRKSVVVFADGIGDRSSLVASAVSTLGPNGCVFEPYNEPVFSISVADYINYNLAPFYTAAKAADPTARVLGSCNVSFNNGSGALERISADIAAGALNYCDDLSVHPYNCFNGDIALSRATLSGLNSLLASHGFTGDVWLTEQGYSWEFGGQTWPRYAARWTAVQFIMAELYGIPVERNVYWYDTSHGFDSVPVWWLSTTGPGPQALPIRTMVAEIGNRVLEAELDFGDGANLWAGGTWVGDDGSRTVGFLAQSFGQPPVRFVGSAATYEVVDCWGNTTTVARSGGVVEVESSEMPTWIRVPADEQLVLIPGDWDWGTNHALGVTASTSLTGSVPISRVTDGVWQNQYIYGSSSIGNSAAPFNDSASNTTLPTTIAVALGTARQVGRVVVAGPPPWQNITALIAFDLEYQNADGSWTLLESYAAPTSTSFVFASRGRCRSETYWSQRSTFVWQTTEPVTAYGIRLVISKVSESAFEDSTWTNNGQVGLGTRLTLGELQVWEAGAAVPPDERPRFVVQFAAG